MRDDAAPGSPHVGIALAALAAVWGLALVSPAQARGQAIGLNWTRGSGAEQCIGPIELARSLEARLGRALFEPAGTAELALEGRVDVDAADGSFRAHVAVVDERGVELGGRELRVPGPDCRALDEALMLVIAVTLYPEGGQAGFGIALPRDVASLLGAALERLDAQSPPPATPPRPSPPTTPARASDEPSLDTQADDSDRPWQVRVGGAGLLRAGASPSATLGAQLALAVAPPGWPLIELAAGVLSRDRAAFSIDGSEGALQVSASRFGLAVCPDALQGALELRSCLGAEALIASASTQGLRQDGERSLIVPALALGLRAAFWLAPSFALGAGAGLSLPLRRPELRVQTQSGQDRSVFEPPVVGGELSVGLIWRATE